MCQTMQTAYIPDILTTSGPIQFQSREGNLTIRLPLFLEIGGAV